MFNLNLKRLLLDSFAEEMFEEFGIIWVVIAIVIAIVAIFIIVIAIKSAIKFKGTANEYYQKVKDKIAENVQKEENKNKCAYCGTRLNESEDRCPNCGARRQ